MMVLPLRGVIEVLSTLEDSVESHHSSAHTVRFHTTQSMSHFTHSVGLISAVGTALLLPAISLANWLKGLLLNS